MEFRGTFQDGVIRPSEPVNLPDGTEVEFQVVNGHTPSDPTNSDFWKMPTLNDLAIQQGVTKPVAPGDLRGEWPEGDSIEEFLRQVREGRR